MIELNGKYTSARVFTEIIDPSAISQIIELCNQPMSEGSHIRIMPDVHAGAGCTIGAFVGGWACNLPTVAREIRLTTFYQGLLETMLPSVPDMRSWQQDEEDVPEDGWGSSWKQ